MQDPKLVLVPAAQGSKFYSVLPSSGVGDFAFSRSGSATRINKDGLIETVGNGVSRLNYPMIDGVVSGCPHHILEPQRTNLIQYSEDFSNSVWDNSNQITRTASATISPDGTLNAFNIKPTDVNSNHTLRAQNLGGFTNGAVVSASFFAKQNGYKYISVVGGFGSSNTPSVIFNLEDGLIQSGTGTIENYGNGWYRCITPITLNSTSLYCIATILNDNLLGSFSGDNTKGIYVYGFQIEEGSYPTSYIPTNGSSVTRSAETANGSGDAATFNDSEGVLMVEGSILDFLTTDSWISISENSNINNNQFNLRFVSNSNLIQAVSRADGLGQDVVLQHTLNDKTEVNKISIKYKLNDWGLWVNGFEVDTETSSNAFTLNSLDVLDFGRGNNSKFFYGNTKQVQYFDTALTDSELEYITSYRSLNELVTALKLNTL
jgi:hypothetical protein